MYSLKEAAESVWLGKPSILKAIQKGRISAKKNELGQWEIDPSELHRVYKAIAREPSPAVASERQEAAEVMELRARLDMMDKLLGQVEGERDDLRRRLDEAEASRKEAAAETRRLTLMLTHQPQPATPPAETARPSFWRRLFGG